MSKSLLIAEKPSVAADIAAALGGFTKNADGFERDDMVISSAVGHLAAIAAPEADKRGKSLETLPYVPVSFNVEVAPDPRVRERFAMLKRLMSRNDVTVLINACDAGREGELIFRLIVEAAGCRKPCERVWLKTMTPDGIRAGVAGRVSASEFDRLGDAARCRTEADWIIGINGSRGVSLLQEATTGRYQMSPTGRVQTPTLAILVDLENKIRNFKPEDYFEVHGTFGLAAGDYVGKWFKPATGTQTEPQTESDEKDAAGYRIFSKAQADALLLKCRGVTPSSVRDETKPLIEGSPKLFDLTTLQREANKLFKFSAADTLKIAQALYERHKVTTYPRTDSSALPEDYVDTAKETLGALARSSYPVHAQAPLANGWVVPTKKIFDNAKISDHFAIIPTGVIPSGLTEAEALIYDLVCKRFIAAFYPAAEYLQTTRITVVAGESFKSQGRVMDKEGWKVVYGATAGASAGKGSLVTMRIGEPVVNKNVEIVALKTKPPVRLTEGNLLGAMEHAGKLLGDDELSDAMAGKGLGTPATRAATIEGLLSTGTKDRPRDPYLVRVKNDLAPTDKGMQLIQFLRHIGVEGLTSPVMTGEWEHKLQLMSEGKYRRDHFMTEIAQAAEEMIAAIRAKAPKVDDVQLSVPCPKCGGSVKGGSISYSCEKGCGVDIKRKLLQRTVTAPEAEMLLKNRVTDQLAGFLSGKTGKLFSAALRLTAEWKVEFEFEAREVLDPAIIAAAPSLTHKCPACKGNMRALPGMFACDAGDFSFKREICGRVMKDNEADYLLEKKKTPIASGFFSKAKQKSYNAGYKLVKDKESKRFKVEIYFD